MVWTAPIDPPFEVHSLATVVRPEQDSLNARFRMLPGLKTQAVFIADDDVLYDMQDVDAMFDAWKGRPFSPHGFWARSHSYSQGQAQYLDSALTNYSSEPSTISQSRWTRELNESLDSGIDQRNDDKLSISAHIYLLTVS